MQGDPRPVSCPWGPRTSFPALLCSPFMVTGKMLLRRLRANRHAHRHTDRKKGPRLNWPDKSVSCRYQEDTEGAS